MTPSLDRIVDAQYWGQHGFPHEEMRELRQTKAVWRYEGGVVDPFWLLTRREHIAEVSRDSELWTSTKRVTIEQARGEPAPIRSIVHMDPPEHGKYRTILQSWLGPANVRRLEGRLAAISGELVDELSEKDEADFVEDIAAIHPVRMLCELLGIPRSQEQQVLRLAKLIFAGSDPELTEGDRATRFGEVLTFCRDLTSTRQARPTDDLASAIANATIDDEPIGMFEVISNLLVLLGAGHDTTASAISGGLLALIQHPRELEKLRSDPSLVPTAAEEIIRWVTPTTNFMRTATADVELGGAKIAKGDDVCLSYASANRDESVFDAPFEFRVDRHPNPHLGFGIGTHGCIGQVLARLEVRTLLDALVPRLQSWELMNEPVWVQAIWVSSLKRLQVRYDVSAA